MGCGPVAQTVVDAPGVGMRHIDARLEQLATMEQHGLVQRVGDRRGVRPDQAAGPELDAAEVAGDHRDHVGEAAPAQHLQHGDPGCAGGLSIVRGSCLIPGDAGHHRGAVVAGVPVLPADGRDHLVRLSHGPDRDQMRDEARLLHDELVRDGGGDRVGVGACHDGGWMPVFIGTARSGARGPSARRVPERAAERAGRGRPRGPPQR